LARILNLIGISHYLVRLESTAMKPLRTILTQLTLTTLAVSIAFAQTSQPHHVHYAAGDDTAKASPTGALAPRLQNLGAHSFPVSCTGDGVQAFFNQGVNLSYGFNHAEAGRAFREVARRAPSCAMAYWGQALVLGPNINAPMAPEDEPKAHELIQKAVSLSAKATPRERDYIKALSARYSGKADERGANDKAYADAMRSLSTKYPNDLDAATLFAESMMDLRPWDYWTRDNHPYPGTEEISKTLARVIARDPNHPGALHFWIHLWEATKTPERAEAAADRLVTLMPGAGHILHMPGHIYQRVGRYQDVVRVNDLAIAADESYITKCRAQGMYPLGYYPHNIHFKWFGATMAGEGQVALDAARKVAAAIPDAAVHERPFLQAFLVVPQYAMVRFGKWDDILKEPKPRYESPFTMAIWHYARGTAYRGLGQFDAAEKELTELRKIVDGPELAKEPATFSTNNAYDVARIAPEMLAGEIEASKKNFDAAVAHLERAVRLHDALIYAEPDDWHLPPRHALGAALLAAGRADEAEVVYWEDLRRNPENGWSLTGLARALRMQKKDELAESVEQRLRRAWAKADVKISSSTF
jgi:tetratricopeptide (TPR) repeat protein